MKRVKFSLSLILTAMLAAVISVPALAKDTTSTITNIKIEVSDSLKELKAGDSWPNLSEGDFTVGDSEKYSIDGVQWYDSNYHDEMVVGDQPKVIVYLNAESKTKSNGDEIVYRFSGSYGSSNVRIVNGNFVSAKRTGYYDMEVVLSLKAVGGTFGEPQNPTWSAGTLGYASWNAPENSSGYYDVALYRENRKVTTITTNSLSLNLYPWMTEPGDYTFSVTTIPYGDGQKKGKKSEAAESDVQTITENNRSDGSGKYGNTQIGSTVSTNSGGAAAQGSTGTVGWFQSNGGWYFRYPNQNLIKSEWLSWKDKWYHFNAGGQMETGWFKSPAGNWFYLDPVNGHAKTGWQNINNVWYYFNTAKGDSEAVMFHNTFGRIGEDYYYFDQNGAMRTGWTAVKDAAGVEQYYYFYDDGRMAKNTEISGFRLDQNGRWVH